jgi:hypothetical protein
VPDLESDVDVGYFDDFSNEEDMAKYKEVYEKQLELSRLADRAAPINKSAFVGFTFRYVSQDKIDVDTRKDPWSRNRKGADLKLEDGQMGCLERCSRSN